MPNDFGNSFPDFLTSRLCFLRFLSGYIPFLYAIFPMVSCVSSAGECCKLRRMPYPLR
nr:MAG TPA: hypothetical protein [Caudoviricetes sp.]